jgi:hypothetical protein
MPLAGPFDIVAVKVTELPRVDVGAELTTLNVGCLRTVNTNGLLAAPFTVTITFPVVAPAGNTTVIV